MFCILCVALIVCVALMFVIDDCDLCKKNCSVYIQCKGDIVIVDIKQHKSQFKNLNFTITQSAKFFDIM